MSSKYSSKTDIKEAKAMAENLQDYIRGDELYGSAEGGFFSRMPSLTVGALLLRLRRLEAMRDSLSASEQQDLDTAKSAWEHVRNEWRLHYEEKMAHEAQSRLDSMKTFFRECGDSMSNCANNYRPEILKRTIVQEIVREMNALNIDNSDVQSAVAGADGKLHQFMRKDEFQWDDELQPIYPREEFWWLYQKPPKPE